MYSKTFRILYALIIAFIVMSGAFGPAHAQSAPTIERVRLIMQDGWTGTGLHDAADDFVLVCPSVNQLPDPSHPCNQSTAGQFGQMDDFILVCPVKEVLSPHPCASRSAQIKHATADDFVLVCPVKEVLDPKHPCAQQQVSTLKFKIPGDFVMTCPVKEVLDPKHPCAH